MNFDPQILHRPDGFLLHPAAGRAAHLAADGRGGPVVRLGDHRCGLFIRRGTTSPIAAR